MPMKETFISHSTSKPMRWINRVAKSSTKKDRIEGPDLIGEVVAFLFMFAVLWLIAAHKTKETGFHIDYFGVVEIPGDLTWQG